MKKQIFIILSILLTLTEKTLPMMTQNADASVFQRVNTYSDGQFTDVAPEDWCNASVGAAYELGLMWGESEDYFDAAGRITVEQAVVMAARLCSIYNTGSGQFDEPGGSWSEPYVSYAMEKGIIADRSNLYDVATRAQFADILSRALPENALEQINEIPPDAIPDVKTGDEYAESIYRLYRAGIVTGTNDRGNFCPKGSISRAEAAAIITRMVDKSLRQSVALRDPGPDLIPREAMDDSFFARSAILGNSLAEGLRMYSSLKSPDYFSATSVSVISATKTRDTKLNDGSTGTLVQALCQKQYDKIYIELGINEIYFNVDRFIKLYGDMIDHIKASEPDADIYILSVLPVTKHKSDSDTVRNMPRIRLYNEALYRLASEKQCYYMDLCSAFQGGDGYLPADWSSDGVHLHAQYYSVWETCMRTLY